MRWKRWIGITTGVIVALLMIVAGVLLFFDYNMLKPYITQAVVQSTGRQLAYGAITVQDGVSGHTHVIRAESLRASLTRLDSPIQLALKATYQGVPIEIEATLGVLRAFLDPDTPWPLQLTAATNATELTLDGTVQAPLTLRGLDLALVAHSQDPTGLVPLLGAPFPLTMPVALTGRVRDLAPKTYGVSDFTASLGKETLGGSLAVQFTTPRPRLTVALASPRLYLRPLLAPTTSAP